MHSDFSIFKDAESDLDVRLRANGIAVIRLDGSNFSKLTRQFEKPFSDVFEHAMNEAATAVARELFPNSLVTYVASDEISVVVSDRVAQLPYGRRIQKLVSVAAATAAVAFTKAVPGVVGTPAFDGRVLELDTPEAIREYITWRRLDCRKNATSMAAGHLRSHKELMGVSTRERGDILVGTPWETIDENTFNGRFIIKSEDGLTPVTASRDFTEELCAASVERYNTVVDRFRF